MPIPSPFHERTLSHCHSMRWKEWGGYHAVCSYGTCHEKEYFAFRHAVGMIDVTPLFKYEVIGPDAGKFLAHLMVKDVRKLKQNQVTYLCWCDDEGKLIDDGTVTRLEENHYRVTAAEPSLSWFLRHARGYDLKIEDSSTKLAALAVQGPNARALLAAASDANMDQLKFFYGTKAKLENNEVYITRTGYTGDLGFEVWTEANNAGSLWDSLIHHGNGLGLEPAGLDALDVTRVESGFIMNGVDYFSANHCIIDSRKSTPYEMGLGWTVKLDREPFIGQKALAKEKEEGSEWCLAGLAMDWDELEKVYAEHNLPPQICSSAWRTPVPIYDYNQKQVGYATSGAWSPHLKKNLALATLKTPHGYEGEELKIEVTVEFTRRTVRATVEKLPFYNPKRKRSLPNVEH